MNGKNITMPMSYLIANEQMNNVRNKWEKLNQSIELMDTLNDDRIHELMYKYKSESLRHESATSAAIVKALATANVHDQCNRKIKQLEADLTLLVDELVTSVTDTDKHTHQVAQLSTQLSIEKALNRTAVYEMQRRKCLFDKTSLRLSDLTQGQTALLQLPLHQIAQLKLAHTSTSSSINHHQQQPTCKSVAASLRTSLTTLESNPNCLMPRHELEAMLQLFATDHHTTQLRPASTTPSSSNSRSDVNPTSARRNTLSASPRPNSTSARRNTLSAIPSPRPNSSFARMKDESANSAIGH